METIGIITEYNPFHNGHLYQINKIKKLTGAKHIVVAMSGDFVQRGTPAWTDKYLRTQMALEGGADLVFELPVCFATASAETFALAGVSLLSSLKFVDGICFGSECGNLTSLKKIADFLIHPTETFHTQLKDLTAQGLSYPTARQKAITECIGKDVESVDSILTSPNNILAIEYLKALQMLQSPLVPYTVKRNDSGYHNETLDHAFASATAIRKESLMADMSSKTSFFDNVKNVLPPSVFSLLKKQKNRFPITENDFSDVLYYRLQALNTADLSILDMTTELYHRMSNYLADFCNYSDFIDDLKTKQYTYSRISRVLLHLLLNICQEDFYFSMTNAPENLSSKKNDKVFQHRLPFTPYARLLGFSKSASSLLRCETDIPVITKPADGFTQITGFYSTQEKAYTDYACYLFQKDLFAANLYTQVQNRKCNLTLPNEYHQKPVIF